MFLFVRSGSVLPVCQLIDRGQRTLKYEPQSYRIWVLFPGVFQLFFLLGWLVGWCPKLSRREKEEERRERESRRQEVRRRRKRSSDARPGTAMEYTGSLETGWKIWLDYISDKLARTFFYPQGMCTLLRTSKQFCVSLLS